MIDTIDQDPRLRELAVALNRTLVGLIVSRGELAAPRWRAAFEAVPRHLFVPRFTVPQNLGGQTHDVTAATDSVQREEWLRAVYQNESLLTDFDEHGIAITSCSMPSVVAIMLEASQAAPGDNVLEIGTGTGWTAALLGHGLGSEAVTSVDISARCVAEARERLNRLSLAPTLAVTDGYLGYPDRAPYDRIISTAALRKVPSAWLDQTRPGGTILTDLRGNFAGNLALLTVDSNGAAHGVFLPETARFMPLRSDEQPFELLPELSATAVKAPGVQSTSEFDPATLRGSAFGFLAQLALPGTQAGLVIDKDAPSGPTTYFCLTDPHSQSWARVEADGLTDRRNWDRSEHVITQGGDRRLWDEVERACELWKQLGEPRPENFTITISAEGHQVVDLPVADGSWSLPL